MESIPMARAGMTCEAVQQGREALEAKRWAYEQTRGDAVTALRIEAATLAERAAHVDELRQVLRNLQEGKGVGQSGRCRRAAHYTVINSVCHTGRVYQPI
jgi:hypothetical protein